MATMLLSWGCSSTARLGSNASKPYLWEQLPHHPQLAWHRFSADSAAVYVRMPAHEPLHLREEMDSPFRFSIELELLIAPTGWPAGEQENRPSSMLYQFRWEEPAQKGRSELVGRFTFPLPKGKYRIVHTVRDLHRGSDVTGVRAFDGWSADAPERCLAFDRKTGHPAWNNNLPLDGTCALLVPPDLSNATWTYAQLPPVDSFPSAPFLDRPPPVIRFPAGVRAVAKSSSALPEDTPIPEGQWAQWAVLEWENKAGAHQWSAGLNSPAIQLSARRASFPIMRDLDNMIRATRFIASRQEYKMMRNARDPKKALDDFWLGFAPSAESARSLIATYYGRVREANVHFSGLKEGWCTDRGMVHIIFGHSDRVRRDNQGETWIYGEEGDVNALIFRFSRKNRGDDFNQFELERYPGFRSPWEAMVSSWRRGKVRNR